MGRKKCEIPDNYEWERANITAPSPRAWSEVRGPWRFIIADFVPERDLANFGWWLGTYDWNGPREIVLQREGHPDATITIETDDQRHLLRHFCFVVAGRMESFEQSRLLGAWAGRSNDAQT